VSPWSETEVKSFQSLLQFVGGDPSVCGVGSLLAGCLAFSYY